MRNRTIAADRERIDADTARFTKEARLATLRGLLADGYPESTGIAACIRDIENDTSPLADRIGRGFTA